MLRAAGAVLFLMAGTAANADTDWGIREIQKRPAVASAASEPAPAGTWAMDQARPAAPARGVDIGAIKNLGTRYGQVTSTYRSPAHNRRVGGVANSYHLRGRAIDIARRAGVSHWQIAAAYRAAGYNLLESLDEGDHSHFAFGNAGETKRRHFTPKPQMVIAKAGEVTEWRIVYPQSGGGS